MSHQLHLHLCKTGVQCCQIRMGMFATRLAQMPVMIQGAGRGSESGAVSKLWPRHIQGTARADRASCSGTLLRIVICGAPGVETKTSTETIKGRPWHRHVPAALARALQDLTSFPAYPEGRGMKSAQPVPENGANGELISGILHGSARECWLLLAGRA